MSTTKRYTEGSGNVYRYICLFSKSEKMFQKCFWNPGNCTTFLHEVFQKIEAVMSDVNSLDTVCKLHFSGKDKDVYYKMYEGKTDMSFIPKEYIDNQ